MLKTTLVLPILKVGIFPMQAKSFEKLVTPIQTKRLSNTSHFPLSLTVYLGWCKRSLTSALLKTTLRSGTLMFNSSELKTLRVKRLRSFMSTSMLAPIREAALGWITTEQETVCTDHYKHPLHIWSAILQNLLATSLRFSRTMMCSRFSMNSVTAYTIC